MTIDQIKLECINRINNCFAIAEKTFDRQFNYPKIDFNLKGQTAGQAWLQQNRIRLNLKIANHNYAEFIPNTPGHEAAHLIVYQLNAPKIVDPHGFEWKHVMRNVLKQDPARCHTYTVVTDYKYKCGCNKIHYFSKRRHNLYINGIKRYRCINCMKSLQPEI